MLSLRHWLSELAEVYARRVGRHGPNRLLPAEVLPAHGLVPGHSEASPPGTGSDRRTAEPSALKACTPRGSTEEERRTMAHDASHGVSHNGTWKCPCATGRPGGTTHPAHRTPAHPAIRSST
jgi:hypothetical protein